MKWFDPGRRPRRAVTASSRRSGPTPRIRLALETLEDRRLLDGEGVLAGAVYHDLDRDGIRDPEEPRLPDWLIELQPTGSTDTPQVVFQNPTPDGYSQYGRFIAASNGRVVVSAHYDDLAGVDQAGAVYVFDAATGQLLHSLLSPDPRAGDRFGRSLAILNGQVLVGAPNDDSAGKDAGAVFLFDEDGQWLRTFTSPDPREDDQFGRAIAVVGQRVLIGARFYDPEESLAPAQSGVQDAGAAYLFDGQTGEHLHSFGSPNPSPNAQFGYSVAAMGDDKLLIGARYDETGADGKGAVYLYDAMNYSLLKSFTNPTQSSVPGALTEFGRSVAAVGENVLVAARYDDTGADRAGAAFLFDGGTGQLLQTFTSPTPSSEEEFGFQVASVGQDVLVGSRWENREVDLGSGRVGAAFLYDGATGQLLQTFANPTDGGIWDGFAMSVASLGEQVVIGTQASNQVYLFDAIPNRDLQTTQADGEFRFEQLSAGTYRLRVQPQSGFAPSTRSGDTYTVQIGLDQQLLGLDFGVVPNHVPSGNNDTYMLNEDETLTVSPAQGVLVNDSDQDGDSLTAVVVSPPRHGLLTLDPDGGFTYAPFVNFNGSDGFAYRATDGVSDSEVINVAINVLGVNDPPQAVDNRLLMLVNTTRQVEAPGVLGNDLDPDSDDALTATLINPPVHGTVTLQADGSYVYAPHADYAGPDSFTYAVMDSHSTEMTEAKVNITVSVTANDDLLEHLRTTEVNYNPYAPTDQERQGGWLGRDHFEFVEIANTGSVPLDLDGVQIAGGIRYEFLQRTILVPGEYAVLVSDIDAFQARYGTELRVLGQYQDDLHNSGERIIVQDPYERPIQDFYYDDGLDWPFLADGFGATAEVRATSGSYALPGNWRSSAMYGGSPGVPGAEPTPTIVINEVLSSPELPQTDAIELHNLTDDPVDISGWYLSNTANDFRLFRIPDNTIIPASDYLVFDEHDFNVNNVGFELNSMQGDDVWLIAADRQGNLLRFIDHVEFGASRRGESFSRWPNGTGDLFPVSNITLGSENTGPRVGPIIINELMYNTTSLAGGQENGDLEFIELYNPTAVAVDLRNWRIRGGIDFDFPNSYDPLPVLLGPGETIVVVGFDPDTDVEALNTFRGVYSLFGPVELFGPFSGSLSNDGDSIRLLRADGPPTWAPERIPHVLEDEVAYDDQSPWPASADGGGHSLNRRDVDQWGNDAGSWVGSVPSPAALDPQSGVLAITEINYHPEWIDFQGRSSFEFLEIMNISDSGIDLAGMQIVDGISFTFPDVELSSGARAVIVGVDPVTFEQEYGPGITILGQYSGGLSNAGETITISGATGRAILSLSYDDQSPWPTLADGQGSSLELADITQNYFRGESWRASADIGGSPGRPGTEPRQPLVINEVWRAGETIQQLELLNTGRAPVELDQWCVLGTPTGPCLIELPSLTLGPHSYLAFPTSITSDGVWLVDGSHYVDQAQFTTAAGPSESWGRWPDGSGPLSPAVELTMGAPNAAPRVGPLVISELMYHPQVLASDEERRLEYIEILNPTDQTVDLTGWRIDGGVQFAFAEGTGLAPREALVIVGFDPSDGEWMAVFQSRYGTQTWVDIVGGYSGSLSNSGDTVRLLRAGTTSPPTPNVNTLLLEDEIKYSDRTPWPISADGLGHSLHRQAADVWGNDPQSWLSGPPSPGAVLPRVDTLAITEFNFQPHAPTEAELAVNPALTATDFEFIELLNVSGAPLDLEGITLAGGVEFTFGAMMVEPAERLLVVKNQAAFNVRYPTATQPVVGQYAGDLHDDEDAITLLRGAEQIVSITYSGAGYWDERASGRGSSLEIVDLAGEYADPDNWVSSQSYGGSPGLPRSRFVDVVVNEVLSHPAPGQFASIELYNTTGQPRDVSGWYFSNRLDDLFKYHFPPDSVIPAHGFLVVDERDFHPNGPWNPDADVPSEDEFSLDEHGDRLWLVAMQGEQPVRFADSVSFGTAASGRSLGRWPDGAGGLYPLEYVTLGAANASIQPASAIVVSEINYHPYPPTAEEIGLGYFEDDFQFIELKNVSEFPYQLSGLLFTNGIVFDFQHSDVELLKPGEYVVVVKNRAAFEARYGTDIPIAGEFDASLDHGGERIELINQFHETVVQFRYDDEQQWPRWADHLGSSLELADPNQVPTSEPRRSQYLEDPAHWRDSGRFGGSPGYGPEAWRADVVINEVLANADAQAGQQDFVELVNVSATPVDLSGRYLAYVDTSYFPPGIQHFQFAAGTVLGPGSYRALSADELGFSLDHVAPFELWVLEDGPRASHSRIVDAALIQPTRRGESQGRWPDGEGPLLPMVEPTSGDENRGVRVGPVLISEVHYHPPDVGVGLDDNDLEFVEIHNPSDDFISLAGWRLEGGIDYWFSNNQYLPPRGTIVVLSFNPDKESNANRLAQFQLVWNPPDNAVLLGGYDGSLSNGADVVRLMRPSGQPPQYWSLEDEISYEDDPPWSILADGRGFSLHRASGQLWGNAATSWLAGAPTPGSVAWAQPAPRRFWVSSVNLNSRPDPQDLSPIAQPTSWSQQHSDLRSIEVQFNVPVLISVEDLRLVNLGVNAPLEDDQAVALHSEQLSRSGNRLTITFPPYSLADGVYQLTILPTAVDIYGNPLDGNRDGTAGDGFFYVGDQVNGFYKLQGDFNGDAGSSIFDFVTFAYWFGAAVPNLPEYVDLNRDGAATIFDFSFFARSFGHTLTFPAALSQRDAGTDFEAHLAVDLSPVARQLGTRPSASWPELSANRRSRRDERALLELLALWQPPTLDARPSVPIINRSSNSSDAWRRPADPAAVDRLYALAQGHDPLGLRWFDEP